MIFCRSGLCFFRTDHTDTQIGELYGYINKMYYFFDALHLHYKFICHQRRNEDIMEDRKLPDRKELVQEMFHGHIKPFLPALIVLLIIGLAITPTMQASLVDTVNAQDTVAPTTPTKQIPKIKKAEKKVEEKEPSKVSGSNVDLSKCADGSYVGTGTGYAGFIKVEVSIKDHAITSLKIVENEADDAPYMAKAKKVLDYIKKAQGTDVDTVSGATYSSNGIISAVNDALGQAAGQKANEVAEKKKKNTKKDNSMNGKKFKDGTYTGTGKGYKSDIHVKVTIAKGKISKIKVTKHNEDQPYMQNAMALIKSIINKQSISVDTVSGATYSSNGIIEGVKKALKKAVGKDDPSLDETPPKDKGDKEDNANDDINDGDEPSNGMYEDGEYHGLARGYKSIFYVTVVVKDGNITSIKIEHDDDIDYYKQCVGIIDRIVKRQTTDGIDTVSGCTLSSNGIINSVKDALKNAKKTEAEPAKLSNTSAVKDEDE